MFIINHTLKMTDNYGNQSFADNYQLVDTIEEAREKVTLIISTAGDDLHCYAISQVIEASEPHWKEPQPILNSAERERDV